MDQLINIRGARQHNLKNISVSIPKNQLIVFTGLSGSGKSSLAFDTIYAEGQRRYVESLSAYARQFLGIMDKPDVDAIDGLSPSISIDQKSTSHNPRSTVGTVTEIYDYLRLLFARIGHPHCPNCGREIARQSVEQIVSAVLSQIYSSCDSSTLSRYQILSPIVRDRKGEFSGLFENLRAKGFSRVRVDQQYYALQDELVLIKTNKHSISVVIDRLTINKKDLKSEVFKSNLKSRLHDAIEQATSLSDGLVILTGVDDKSFDFPEKPKITHDYLFSERFSCPQCNISLSELEPRSFSFNSPHGACSECNGLGEILKIDHNTIINPNLTITEGGILPFAKMFMHDTWFSRLVKKVCEEHDIPLRNPLSKVDTKQIKILLEGTGRRDYRVYGTNRQGKNTSISEQFPGLIYELERRYKETDSDYIRQEIEKYMRQEICVGCHGSRLKTEALAVTINNQSIANIVDMPIVDCSRWLSDLKRSLKNREQIIGEPIIKEILTRLIFLESVGLTYLMLSRSAASLSGGEAQRIRLASQIGTGLTGVLYVLDEPSIGLHQRDNQKLIRTLKKLRNLGNTVIVVEHDREVIESADWILDFGPKAGDNGGQIVFSADKSGLRKHKTSLTAKYIRRPELTWVSHKPATSTRALTLVGACAHNLKKIRVDFPLGQFICVTGVSGSGKSTLVVETLYQALKLKKNPYSRTKPGGFDKLIGDELIDKVILVDQSPIGRTPRSNPATYISAFTHIRKLYASLSDAKAKGYKPGRFSFNVRGGRCDACDGEGQTKIEMQFLSDVFVTCEVCHGLRYNSETLEVKYKGKSIADVLKLSVAEALDFFRHFPPIETKLKALNDVGLSYIALGQPAPTLSGGEAQRVKLASELSKRQTGKTLYLLDEPTTGLHFADLVKLLKVLFSLVDRGNTVVVIEHNLDIIKNADYIIDLGPEGGDAGGEIIAQGPPKAVAKVSESYTGQFLREILTKS